MSESADLNREKTLHLKNFLDLLVELSIVESSKQVSEIPFNHEKGGSNYRQKSKQYQNNLNSDDISFVEIANHQEASDTVYLEAKLDSPQIQVQSSTYSEPTEEITVQITPFEQNLDRLSQFNPDRAAEQIVAFQNLQDILVGNELANIHQDLENLNHQLYDSDELIKLLLPQITELLRRKISESKAEVIETITPIIDNAIRSRVEQDKESMGNALAAAVPIAIAQQINVNSDEFASAIAPTMGEAIQKQIILEKDKIVDALYPVIGNTIAKYMGETIQAINAQVENTLSVEGIKRKIKAKLQGVSEAELIVRESISFTPQAIFLIHKASGLVICDIQPTDSEHLESDMIAGMLTAIRSFANDCMSQSEFSELDEIDYGNFKIILEVGGYCYLAIIVKGETPKHFISQMRHILGKIIGNHGKSIENFDGDLATISPEINRLLETLKDFKPQKQNNKNQPSPLFVLSLTLLSIILIPWGIWQYRSNEIHTVENKTGLALASVPELSVYRIDVKVNGNKLKLIGRVPNDFLKTKANKIAALTVPNWQIDNQIIAIEIPASPVLAAAEVERVSAVLNRIDGNNISTNYTDGKVTIFGNVTTIADAQIITQAFEQIPGVKMVSSTVQIKSVSTDVRFYFQPDSLTLVSEGLENKIKQVEKFLDENPIYNLKLIGYSYSQIATSTTEALALKRAEALQQKLIEQGISPSRLQIVSKTDLPPGVDVNQPSWLKRCVVLEAIIPDKN